ncbi:FAD:protein FMN transferase [Cnuibacter physcomitrellae]|uniref:FAD:protein FMN transferase n=1 Tax=Cnuibacter physcomitrellae TaxID=1619308 RepID=UPI002175F301|nr:FAD:protein FMN transferase [Cnuibacter physcomitrellae]MCS5495727.1 FAD:protein FMN transferase [Cnuibacter physcomitrellae]
MPPADLAVDARHTLDFDAIGTRWQIETGSPLDDATRAAVAERIELFDRAYSRFRPDSLVSRLAREGGRVEFPADAGPLFDVYDRVSALTEGAVDPLVGRELERLGYDAEYSFTPHPERVAETRRWSDLRREGTAVDLSSPALLDVGAAGKGHLVDIVSDLLVARGYERSVVDGSGDLRHRLGRPGGLGAAAPGRAIRVALEHPLDATQAIGVAELGEGALCASAGNRRAWGDGVHHILDARTGRPAREVIATWVIAATALQADALATALFFAGAHTLATAFPFSYVRMFADGRAEISRDFPGELFT